MASRLTDREQWELVYPQMGYMATLRNLRNFDQAGIKPVMRKHIGARLADPQEVAQSRQLPFRFWSAFMNSAANWQPYLSRALDASTRNVPELPGRTLVLIDTSGSMSAHMSSPRPRGKRTVRGMNAATGLVEEREPKTPQLAEAAALFGMAFALRNPGRVDVWGFADSQMLVTGLAESGKSLLETTALFVSQIGRVGHGTQIRRAVHDTYTGQDRILVFSDMQGIGGNAFADVPVDKHCVAFNVAGYSKTAMTPGATRHEIGGLSDASFALIPQLEMTGQERWPWE